RRRVPAVEQRRDPRRPHRVEPALARPHVGAPEEPAHVLGGDEKVEPLDGAAGRREGNEGHDDDDGRVVGDGGPAAVSVLPGGGGWPLASRSSGGLNFRIWATRLVPFERRTVTCGVGVSLAAASDTDRRISSSMSGRSPGVSLRARNAGSTHPCSTAFFFSS